MKKKKISNLNIFSSIDFKIKVYVSNVKKNNISNL